MLYAAAGIAISAMVFWHQTMMYFHEQGLLLLLWWLRSPSRQNNGILPTFHKPPPAVWVRNLENHLMIAAAAIVQHLVAQSSRRGSEGRRFHFNHYRRAFAVKANSATADPPLTDLASSAPLNALYGIYCPAANGRQMPNYVSSGACAEGHYSPCWAGTQAAVSSNVCRIQSRRFRQRD